MAIRTLSTREIYRNPWLSLREDAIQRSNGAEGIYSVVDKQDCAVIVPIDRDHIWLVEQFRYTIGERALELPQGGWEQDIVDPEELARGELREETGLTAGRMTELPWMWIAYGFTRQRQHVLSPKSWFRAAISVTRKSLIWRSYGCPLQPSSKSLETVRFATCVRLLLGPATAFGGSLAAELQNTSKKEHPHRDLSTALRSVEKQTATSRL